MWHSLLSAIALVLAFGNSVPSQQRLVVHNDQDDPCRRFKMRILVPPDVDYKISVKSFAGGIDSRMVWDPCTEHGTQIAVFSGPGLNRKELGFPTQPPSFKRGFGENGQKGPGEFLQLRPMSGYQLKLRQP